MSDGYEVGYGKPPRHTQFKPGQSGNPKGRPKGTRNLKTDFQEEMNERVAVREGGKTRKVSKQRAALMRLSEKALQGDIRAINILVAMNMRLLGEVEEAAGVARDLPASDRAILDRYVERRLAGNGAETPALEQQDHQSPGPSSEGDET